MASDDDLIVLSDEDNDEDSSGEGDEFKEYDDDGVELTAQFLEDEDEDERLGGDCYGNLQSSIQLLVLIVAVSGYTMKQGCYLMDSLFLNCSSSLNV